MYYKQPRYFSVFQCIGEECPNNCCHNWNIHWKKEEIDNVLNAENISPELHERAENSFVLDERANDGGYLIKLDDSGKCPFQTENGLCLIQKELGESYLSHTCTLYPRSSLHMGSAFYRFCNMSCPVIISQLLEYKKSMDLVTTSMAKDVGKTIYASNNIAEVERHPEQKYREEIFDFFYELISDKELDAEDAILLGALSAEALTQLVSDERYNVISDELEMLSKAIRTPEMIQSVKDAPAHIPAKLAFLPWIVENIAKNSTIPMLKNEDGSIDIEKYNLGAENLRAVLKGKEHFMRNLALQLLFEFDVPFRIPNRSILDNYALFVTAYSCIKLNMIAAVTKDPINILTISGVRVCEGYDRLIVPTALMVRGICQNPETAAQIIDLLKKKQYDTPPYFAILMK